MIRALELFSGIGGFAAAAAHFDIRLVGAFDQSPAAVATYRLNFPDHPVREKDITRLSPWELITAEAGFWWLSPPCQPYCERGTRRDLDDPRAQSLRHVMKLLADLPDGKLPVALALENVAGFIRSQAREQLHALLSERGYHLTERLLCPTELGVPSRRPRYYLAASRLPLAAAEPFKTPIHSKSLSSYLDRPDPADLPPELILPADTLARFGSGLRILDPEDPDAVTTCFIAGYGRSLVNAGSYLRCGDSVRYVTPEEIVRLLHFPPSFRFPENLTLRQRWHLAGNSMSVAAVCEILRLFPEIAATEKKPSRTEP